MESKRRLKNLLLLFLVLIVSSGFMITLEQYSHTKEVQKMSYKNLTLEEERIILNKGTERPHSGKYNRHFQDGTYTCKRCGAKLFESDAKFESECGWPSFDDAIKGSVLEQEDADGMRVEIVCAKCKGHLGHVFRGERMTSKNTRHCVNSLSIDFEVDENSTQNKTPIKTEKAYFAGGCFWGVEYYLEHELGVISAISGYMGGRKVQANYEDVCDGRSGHAETVMVTFDPQRTTYEKLARLFFEIHDPTELDQQGPDIGNQYRSVIFYDSSSQKKVIKKLIGELEDNGYKVVTKLEAARTFYKAEEFHQNYYQNNGKVPYCHRRVKRF